MNSAATRYFDALASDYDRRSGRGFWSVLRAFETRAMLRLAGMVAGASVLDLGCGSGFYSCLLRDRGARVCGVDASAQMTRELRLKGIEAHHADAATVCVGRSFDVILAAGLVEFLADEHTLFESASRHAHSGTRLLVLAPRSGLIGGLYEWCHRWMGCPASVRTRKSLRAAAVSQGWNLDAVAGAGPLAIALRFTLAAAGADG